MFDLNVYHLINSNYDVKSPYSQAESQYITIRFFILLIFGFKNSAKIVQAGG